MRKKKKRISGFDRGIFALAILLTLLGIIAVADASSPQALSVFKDPYYFLKQQVMWGAIGLGGMIVVSFIPYLFWKKTAWIFFGVSTFFLLAVLVPGVGVKVLGARRWILLGVFRFQPSELAKLALVVLLARLMANEGRMWWGVGVSGLVMGLIMLQPDLGTTIIISAVVMAELFVAGMPFFYFLSLGFLAVVAGSLMIYLSEYRRERLASFVETTIDPLGSSYHIRQVLIALGSGGVWGVGLGQSRQKHLFLPETATDSVFAIIGEEVGFLGASVIVVVLTIFTLRVFKIASLAPDKFSQLLAVGIGMWIGGQTFLNIASMVALTPLTGIPLPFFSYGGSSLTMLLISVGILLNISKYGGKSNAGRTSGAGRGRR